MTYTNTPAVVSQQTTSYSSGNIPYTSIALLENIPHSAQLEVERIFVVDRDGSAATLLAFLADTAVTTAQKKAVFIIPISRCTLDTATKNISAINLPASGDVYNYVITTPTPTTYTIKVPILSSSTVTVRRKTVSNEPLVNWVAGSRLTSKQLNLATTQSLYLLQEAIEKIGTSLTLSATQITVVSLADAAVTPSKISTTTDPWSFYGTIQTVAPTANLHATTRLYALDKFFQHGVMTKDDVAPTSSAVDILETAATAGNSGLWFNPKNGTINLWAGNAWVTVAGTPVTTANLVTTNTVQTVTAAKTFSAGTVVPFTQTGTGAVARTVDDKLKDTVSVKDFGSNLGVALTALGATETTLIIDDDVTVSVNTTIPVTLAIEVKNGSVITINNTIVLTINGSFSAGMNKVFDGAGATNTVFAAVGDIFARWFGAKGDDSTDDSTSIQKAINVAQQSDNANVVFGSGIFRIGTTLSITNANKGISIIGTRDSALQQGSVNSNCVIKWVGGAGHCFTSTVTFCNFYSMTFLNAAGYNALSAINLTPNAFGHSVIEDVTVTFVTAGAQFATACFILEGASYSKINRCYLNGSTTGILFTGTTSTTTNILNCEFDYPATALETCYSIKLNSNIEILTCEQCTFNLYHNTQAFNTAASVGFDSAHFFDCEFDSDSGSAFTKVAYINDFRFVRFEGCAIAQLGSTTGGIIQALSSAGNPYAQSVISINNCHGASLNGPLVQTDGNAKIVVNCGLNSFSAGSTGLVIGTSAKSALLFDIDTAAVTYLPLLGQKFPANLDGVYQIETTTNLNRQIVIGTPTDSAPLTGSMEKGQKFFVKIKNTSGGALTVLTFGTQFKMPALVLPATGFSRSYYFVYDGTNAIELTRSAADIPN